MIPLPQVYLAVNQRFIHLFVINVFYLFYKLRSPKYVLSLTHRIHFKKIKPPTSVYLVINMSNIIRINKLKIAKLSIIISAKIMP